MTPEELTKAAEKAKTALGGNRPHRIGGESALHTIAKTPVVTPVGPVVPIPSVNPPVQPEPVVKTTLSMQTGAEPPITMDRVIRMLIDSPATIQTCQRSYDDADRAYKTRLVDLTLKAFAEPLFPGKKPEDGLRPASNEDERAAAVDKLCASDVQLITFAQQREAALRDLIGARNQFEGGKLIAQLLCKS